MSGQKLYNFGTSVGVAVGFHSGGRLATPLVAIIFTFIFFPVITFSHRRSARIKKLILRKLTGAPMLLERREVISIFLFGGSKTRLPFPEGGRQTKSCLNQKTCLAKVDQNAHITIER